MPARRTNDPNVRPIRRPPATTPEARENQLVALAVDLAERQMAEGSASAQVIAHYLKLGSSREKLEQEQLAQKNELLKVQRDAIASAKRVEELYTKALGAMRAYGGHEPMEPEEEIYD